MDSDRLIPEKFKSHYSLLIAKFPDQKKTIFRFCSQDLPRLSKKGYDLNQLTPDFLEQLFISVQRGKILSEACFHLCREWLDRKQISGNIYNFFDPWDRTIFSFNLDNIIKSALTHNPLPVKKKFLSRLRYWMGIIMSRYRGYIPGKTMNNLLKNYLKK